MGGLNAAGFRKIFWGALALLVYRVIRSSLLGTALGLSMQSATFTIPLSTLSEGPYWEALSVLLGCLHVLAIVMLINGLGEAYEDCRDFALCRSWCIAQLLCAAASILLDGVYVALNNRGLPLENMGSLYLVYMVLISVLEIGCFFVTSWMSGRHLLAGFRQLCYDCGGSAKSSRNIEIIGRFLAVSAAGMISGGGIAVICALIVNPFAPSVPENYTGPQFLLRLMNFGLLLLAVSTALRMLVHLRIILSAYRAARTVAILSD
ncbi:MAG: hypothetical protein IKP40_01655 [Clostridia bacterium]|nr:hypothetical protein [Clostridia bacterium]